MHTKSTRVLGGVIFGVLLVALGPATRDAGAQKAKNEDRMSAMGRLAIRERARMAADAAGSGLRATAVAPGERDIDNDDLCQNDPRCPGGFREGPDNTQSELSIAIDNTGQNVVVGFNDFRGFAKVPVSVSGYMYSGDGGQTFVDGGQLPVTTGTETIGTTVLPQIFGDPEVKHLGGCTFVYSSILLKKFNDTSAVQTMGVHRSTDCGKTWTGPYEVQAATNPNGNIIGGAPADAADKEFMDVDPDTGRLIMTWTNFTPISAEIRSAVSDDGGFTWPASGGRVIAATDADGQSSVPRFARGSNNVYVTWRRFPFPGELGGYGNTTAFARSTDNGSTWQAPIELSPEFLTQDLILGNDRSNTSPSMAVDRSNGPRRGTIYVVYPNNNSVDGSDIVFQKSTNGGVSFSAPLLLNSRPGEDRAQWFPSITVDDTTGRVSVFYYDQGIATTGHLSEISYLFSNDGGRTWEHPRPLTRRPFKAGHGNDTSQPNLGDYNQAVARGGKVWFAYAVPNRPAEGFADGQPTSPSMTSVDATVRVVSPLEHATRHAPVSLQNVSHHVNGGFADPGETIAVRLPLFNYATNPLYASDVKFPVGVLTTDTPGVIVTDPIGLYSTIHPGQTRSSDPFELRLRRSFVPGTAIELKLTVLSITGVTVLHHTLFTGTPVETTLLQEGFDGVAPPALPAGWTSVHAGGAVTVPWTTSDTFCATSSNGAFHVNATGTRFERLFSPTFAVPADAEYVVIEFDVCYDTEDDPVLPTTAYDGFLLRVTDVTTGRFLRSVLIEAFEDEFTTGDIFHYPKHFPRSSNPNYFQDMSAWAGSSGGFKHVRMRLPGMQGSTAQLRFEFTQDATLSCLAVRPTSAGCGVFVDNIVVKSVVSKR